ncbi:cytochrome p450 protein [Apiospora rasikravindrae]|uniref:Cytochrome p450 protein n=1 Tax=Apiospora rasikravindrae TaxID=990691 RepID=A0ABR1RPD4_9PEZI
MDTDRQVYLGLWTNWSRGSAVMGATLTTTREQGNFLIAITAFFVPFVASRFWRIFAILMHQCYSTSDSRETIYHQRQIWQASSLRKSLRRVKYSLLGTIAKPLEDSFYEGEDLASASASFTYWGIFIQKLSSYARQCYTDDSSGFLECSKLVTSAITTAVKDYDAPCPFKTSICRRNSSNLRLDTGHLNSNDVFGLNSPKADTFTLRYVLQCSPLSTEGRTENIAISGRNFTTYNYGPMVDRKRIITNFTYKVPDIATHSRYFTMFNGSISGANFDPDPALVRSDGDVSLLFLSGNGVIFEAPIDDDWYRATAKLYNATYAGQEPRPEYHPEEAASPLGCLEQFQLCRDPALGQCGNLGGIFDSISSAAPVFNWTDWDSTPSRPISKTKLGSLFVWIYLMQFNSAISLTGIADSLGPASLASQTFVGQGYIDSIENNQWQLDVTQW